MRRHVVALIAALTVGGLAAVPGSAAGANLGLYPAGEMALSGSIQFAEAFGHFACDITLSGQFYGSFGKSAGSPAGQVTRARAGACTTTIPGASSPTLAFLLESPWPITFYAFGGLLPNIDVARFTLEAIRVLFGASHVFGNIGCLWVGRSILTADIERRHVVTLQTESHMMPLSLFSSSLHRNPFGSCPRELAWIGIFNVTPVQELLRTE